MRVLRATAARARRAQTAKRTVFTVSTYKNVALRRPLTNTTQKGKTTTRPASTNRQLHKKQTGNVPRNPTTSGSELAAFLCSLQTDDGPAVFPKVISFASNTERKGWIASMPDAKERATIAEFLRYPLRTKRGRLALISCTTDNWVQQKDKPSGDQGTWSDIWHISAVALLPSKQPGKHLVVWDCDPNLPNPTTGKTISQCRAKEVLRGVQRSLWEEIRKRTSQNCQLWYNIDTSFSGKNKCLQSAATVIKNWASIADEPLNGPRDPRVKRCVSISAL